MSKSLEELTALLEGLRIEYLAAMPERSRKLASECAQAIVDSSARPDAIRTAHTIRGTAGTHGLEALSLAGGKLEQRLRALSDTEAVNASDLADLMGALGEVLLAAREATRVSDESPAHPKSADTIQAAAMLAGTPSAPMARAVAVGFEPPHATALTEAGARRGVEITLFSTSRDALDGLARKAATVLILHDARVAGESGPDPDRAELLGWANRSQVPVAVVVDADEDSAGAGSGWMDRLVQAATAGVVRVTSQVSDVTDWTRLLDELVVMADSRQGRVLLIDDDPSFTDLVTAVLQAQGAEVCAINDSKAHSA